MEKDVEIEDKNEVAQSLTTRQRLVFISVIPTQCPTCITSFTSQ